MMTQAGRARYFPLVVFVSVFGLVQVALAAWRELAWPHEIAVSSGAGAATAGADLDTADVDAFVADNLRHMGIPGAIVAIARNGRVLHAAGYGHTASGAQITPDTPLPIASLTKSFTALAALQLVEAGTLELDASIGTYLEDVAPAGGRGTAITLRHLLNQTSGFVNRGLPPQPAVMADSLRARAEWLRGARVQYEPGTRFNYFNDNYNLLAHIVERAGGEPYAAYLERRIFRPLGMRNSSFHLNTAEETALVGKGYALIAGVPVKTALLADFGGGGGGIVSTANDLARWLALQSGNGAAADGTRLVSADSLLAMHTASAPGSNYGFGWREDKQADGSSYVHHSGKLPPFAAHAALFPASGYAYAIVLNGFHGFNAEAVSFVTGLNQIMAGEKPRIGFPYRVAGWPFGMVADQLSVLLAIVVASIALVATARVPAWTAARRNSGWSVAWRCLPYALVSLLVFAAPLALSVVNRGQGVPWRILYGAWPAFAICVGFSGAACAWIVAVRLYCFARTRRRPANPAAE